MEKKNHSKKLKLDHEPVRAMAEPPRKIYQDARRKAAALRRAKNVLPKDSSIPLPRNSETSHPTDQGGSGCPGSATDLSSITDERGEDGRSRSDGSTTTIKSEGPTATTICTFHPTSEVHRRISAKGWDYIKCPEGVCPYWVRPPKPPSSAR